MGKTSKLSDCRILNVYREGPTLKIDIFAGDGLTIDEFGNETEIENIISTVTIECDAVAYAHMFEITAREWRNADTVLIGEVYPDVRGVRLTDELTGKSLETTDCP